MGSFASISLLFLLSLSIPFHVCSSRKIGLKTAEVKTKPIFHHENESSSTHFDPSKVVQLSWHPRAFLYKGFLSEEECEHLISQVHVGKITLNSTGSVARGQDEIITKIEERISAWAFLPKENGEDMRILHHKTNESTPPKFDYYLDKSSMLNGGNRVATVLMYLSTVPRGGETVFPRSELKGTQAKDKTWSDCASTGYAVKPVKGDALLLFNLRLDGTIDESSLHGSCTVIEGEKWSAVKWIHTRAFNANRQPTPPLTSDEECTDEDDNCSSWAAKGECQRNPVYMLGTPDYYGSCRKSCGAC